MTDAELITKKLAFIETCVREIRVLGQPDRIKDDLREERFVVHSLQIAIQAAIDVASHIVSDERWGEPRTNRELFELLAREDRLPRELERSMVNMTGFRNIVVHGYQNVNLDIVKDVVDHHLETCWRSWATFGAGCTDGDNQVAPATQARKLSAAAARSE